MLRSAFVRALGVALALPLVFGAVASAQVEPSAVLLRYPDVGPEHIVFRYAADLWLVPKTGGTAMRITSAEGGESFPRFSPDGSQIAFVAGYDGGSELYVMPALGGVPRRVTWHPAQEILCGWTPDGASLVFFSPQASGIQRAPKLFTVPIDGGAPVALPVPYGVFGTIDPTGDWLAYTPSTREFRTWKRYQGGLAQDVWLFHLRTHESRRLTDWLGTDAQPMWFGRKVLFVSDRGQDGVLNLWSVDLDANTFEQLTDFTEFGVRFASAGKDEVVFENGGMLYLYRVADGNLAPVDVVLPGDRPSLRPERRDVSGLVQSLTSGPSGKRAIVEARGELFDVPTGEGATRLLSGTSGAAERMPAWSPDGRFVAYFSDRWGEYELTLRRVDGKPFEGSDERGERRLTELGAGFRSGTSWSPDSEKIAFTANDGSLRVFHLDLASPAGGRLVDVATNPQGGPLQAAWSASSDWLAWSHRHSESRLDAIYLHHLETGETHEVTSGLFDDSEPTFDPKGEYLYFHSSRDFAPLYGDLERTWIYANSRALIAVPLRDDVDHPTAPKDPVEAIEGEEEDEADDDEADDASGSKDEPDSGAADSGDEARDADAADGSESKADDEKDADADGEKDAPEPLEIDLDGFESRAVRLPVDAGNLRGTLAVEGGLLFTRRPNTGADGDAELFHYDLEEREAKKVIAPVSGYELTADRKRLLVESGGKWGFVAPKPDQKLDDEDDRLDFDGLAAEIDPREEWRQMLVDTWRLFRDYFYEPTMHGLDWPAVLDRYAAALGDATSREDLHFLTGEMMAELNIGHAYNRTPPGGLIRTADAPPVGLLGADVVLEQGAWRIQRILGGEPAETDGRSPLAEPGVDVDEGAFVLAVDGRPIATDRAFEASFVGTAGRPTRLTVDDDPTLDGDERDVLVVPLASEEGLRYRDWVAGRRAAVHELSGGRVGYVHVPDTGVNGQTELVRQFYGERHRDALLVDERWNGGGQIPTRFIELLRRPLTNFWAVRHGEDWPWPEMTHVGPKAMLINGWSGSGGDAFPYYFRQAGLGLLFGQRTWGGLVGISGNPALVDGTAHAIPTFGFYELDGTWGVEGWGVDPDVPVVDDPTAMAAGGDPQLEAAVAHLVAELEANPPSLPARPASPNRSGVGIDPRDH